jgi:hypothetical protein
MPGYLARLGTREAVIALTGLVQNGHPYLGWAVRVV